MRFLLVNPHYPISEGPSPPLGISFLAAALEAAGVEVKVLDFVVFPYAPEFLAETLNRFRPDFVGVTAVTMNFNHAIQVVRDAKKIAPDSLTVMGGPHVSFCARETLAEFPELDFVIRGEGERSLVNLVRESAEGRQWARVNGLVYRNGTDICETPAAEPIWDIDNLPMPARHHLPLMRYRALNLSISMTTSRGCPFQCIFCVGRKMVGAKVRYRNPMHVVDELEQISRFKFRQINVADDLFTANKKHCTAICDEIIKRKLNIKWSSFARVDTVSRDVLAKMKAAGCDSVSFGVETANADILKTIRKGITLDQVIEAVQMCNDVGIQPSASFILGLPGETPETLKETVAFGERLGEMNVIYGFHLLAPFPGTAVRERHTDYGLRILTDDWSQYHANRAIVETDTVDRRMLDEIAIGWEKKIDQWLGDIDVRIKSGEADDEEAYPLVNLVRTVIVHELMMGRVIETQGTRQGDATEVSEAESLKMLVDRLAVNSDRSADTLQNVLGWCAENGFLRRRVDSTGDTWEWVDYFA